MVKGSICDLELIVYWREGTGGEEGGLSKYGGVGFRIQTGTQTRS